MEATYISRRTANLTTYAKAVEYGVMASEVAQRIGTGTMTTDELLAASALHLWLLNTQAALFASA